MNTVTIFALAILAALADVAVVLTWLKIEPKHITNAEWWRMHQVTITGGKIFLMSTLAVASLSLSSYGFYRSYYGQVRRPTLVEWGTGQNRCTETIDTSAIVDLADKYYIVGACGLSDPTVELLNDKRISLSDLFYIAGTQQKISIKFSAEMANAIAALRTEGESSLRYLFSPKREIFLKCICCQTSRLSEGRYIKPPGSAS